MTKDHGGSDDDWDNSDVKTLYYCDVSLILLSNPQGI